MASKTSQWRNVNKELLHCLEEDSDQEFDLDSSIDVENESI